MPTVLGEYYWGNQAPLYLAGNNGRIMSHGNQITKEETKMERERRYACIVMWSFVYQNISIINNHSQ
jgi:hypothetical protein